MYWIINDISKSTSPHVKKGACQRGTARKSRRLRQYFDEPKTTRCRSSFFNGSSILALLSSVIFHSVAELFAYSYNNDTFYFIIKLSGGWRTS